MKHLSFFKASLVMLVSVISLLMPQKILAQYKIDNCIKANNILQYNGKDFIPTNKTIRINLSLIITQASYTKCVS